MVNDGRQVVEKPALHSGEGELRVMRVDCHNVSNACLCTKSFHVVPSPGVLWEIIRECNSDRTCSYVTSMV